MITTISEPGSPLNSTDETLGRVSFHDQPESGFKVFRALLQKNCEWDSMQHSIPAECPKGYRLEYKCTVDDRNYRYYDFFLVRCADAPSVMVGERDLTTIPLNELHILAAENNVKVDAREGQVRLAQRVSEAVRLRREKAKAK